MAWVTKLTARTEKARGRKKLKRGATEEATKPRFGRTHLGVEKSLEAGGDDCGPAKASSGLVPTARGKFLLTKEGGCAERETPGQRILDVVAGWNKPAEPRAEKTVERLRKPEGGTRNRLGADCGIACPR